MTILLLMNLNDFSEQKWSKGKVRDKLNNLILFDAATYDKLYKEVPSYKLITPSVVSERLKIRGSLARAALQELLDKGEFMNIFPNPKTHQTPFPVLMDSSAVGCPNFIKFQQFGSSITARYWILVDSALW